MDGQMIKRLQKKERRAALLIHEGDRMRAEVGQEMLGAATDETHALEVLQHKIGLHNATAKTRIAQGHALNLVPERDVWASVGWTGVRLLIGLGKRERSKRVKAIGKQYKADGKQHGYSTAKVLCGGKVRPRAKTKPSAPAGNSGLLAKALSDLAKLAAFNPGTLALLCTEVRYAVEAQMKKRA